MTNFKTITGSFAWATCAVMLMLAAFEPVTVERQVPGAQLAAQAGGTGNRAAA